MSDVVWFVYSQVTDAITIHQVFQSGRKEYAFPLLAILVLPFLLVYVLVARMAVKQYHSRVTLSTSQGKCRVCLHKTASCLLGLAMSPLFFFSLEIGMITEGFGCALPDSVLLTTIELSTLYRMKSIVESVFNALPQAIIQTKLYIMGNDPGGIRVYIDTTLFLSSVIGSQLSILKTVALVLIELHLFGCNMQVYFSDLLNLRLLKRPP